LDGRLDGFEACMAALLEKTRWWSVAEDSVTGVGAPTTDGGLRFVIVVADGG
jgi:hypothetical protein